VSSAAGQKFSIDISSTRKIAMNSDDKQLITTDVRSGVKSRHVGILHVSKQQKRNKATHHSLSDE
jgi:hypothetical protein